MLSVSLLFQQAHLWPLEKPKNPPAALLLHTNHPSAASVVFRKYNDSVTSSREITGSYYALKGHSASGQGGSSWSSPLRSDGSQDDQVGEEGPVEP
jgi:hypothetical protein